MSSFLLNLPQYAAAVSGVCGILAAILPVPSSTSGVLFVARKLLDVFGANVANARNASTNPPPGQLG